MIILKKGVFTFLAHRLSQWSVRPKGRAYRCADRYGRLAAAAAAAGPNGASDGPNGAPAQQNWTPDDPNDVKTKYFILICCVFFEGEGWGGSSVFALLALFSDSVRYFRIVFVLFSDDSRFVFGLFSLCFRIVFAPFSLFSGATRRRPEALYRGVK